MSERLPAGVQAFERGWLSSNHVLFVDQHQTVLVDSGFYSHADLTLQLVREGLNHRNLDAIYCTHLHSDHCGGIALLQSALGPSPPTTWVPAADLPYVQKWDQSYLSFDALGQFCPRFQAHEAIHANQTFVWANLPWQALESGGHHPDSVVFYQADHQILISADALWQNGFGIVFPEAGQAAEDSHLAFVTVKQTLDRLGQLNVSTVIPGHGSIFNDFEEAMNRAYKRLDYFCSDPERHARFALKALTKYHLLEKQSLSFQAFFEWVNTHPYFSLLQVKYFPKQSLQSLLQVALEELAVKGHIRIADQMVFNL